MFFLLKPILGFIKKVIFFIFMISILVILFGSKCGLTKYLQNFQASLTPGVTTTSPTVSASDPVISQLIGVLSSEYNTAADKITVKKIEPVIWTNSCMDIQSGSTRCDNVITPGFKVGLDIAGTAVVYHVSKAGNFIRE